MSLARELVATLRHLGHHAFDHQVAASTQLHVADTIGVMLAARRDDTLYSALCAAMGGDLRHLPPSHAAFVMAALAHALDFDDIHDQARLHPTPVTLAAALACADASGQTQGTGPWLLGVALGNELMCRLGLACAPQGSGAASQWFLTQLFGALGAAVAAGWMLGLDDAQLTSAIGFACMQASGHKEPGFGVGSNARQLYPAFAALAGVTAARLAAAGLSAPSGSLDGSAGLLKVYLQREADAALRHILLDDQRWHALDIAIKPWPCCRLSHPYVAAALALRARLGKALCHITKLTIHVNESAAKLCAPLAGRIRPATLADAKYSIPFLTAWTLCHGEPTLDRLTAASLTEATVMDLTSRIEVQGDQPDRPGHPRAHLEAWARGRMAPVEAIADGVPDLDRQAVLNKFMSNTAHAGYANGQNLWQQLMHREVAIPILRAWLR